MDFRSKNTTRGFTFGPTRLGIETMDQQTRRCKPLFGHGQPNRSNVVKTITNYPFGNGLYHLFMVIWGMVYDCFNYITGSFHPVKLELWIRCADFYRAAVKDISDPPGWEPLFHSFPYASHKLPILPKRCSPFLDGRARVMGLVVDVGEGVLQRATLRNNPDCWRMFFGAFLLVFMSNHPLFELGFPGSPCGIDTGKQDFGHQTSTRRL